jgi:uracil-DNA glycosylase
MQDSIGLDNIIQEIRACQLCANILLIKPKPIIQAGSKARILIVSQAPGAAAEQSGMPFDDSSGDRQRHWLRGNKDAF